MNNYHGVIIEESLDDQNVLNRVTIVSTKIEEVTNQHKTPWLRQWTLHTVEVPEEEADEIAKLIQDSLETAHTAWYADYNNNSTHYIIFPERIFCIDRSDRDQYKAAKEYGISIGIPEHQVDFDPEGPQWER